MFGDELVTLGDVLDFLEWRRIYRGVRYNPPSLACTANQLPSVRFYYQMGRMYTVSSKGQLYRLKGIFKKTLASTISCCSFGDNSNSWITPGFANVSVQTKKINGSINLKEGVISSLFENGYVIEQHASRDGNRVVGITRK